MKIFTGFIRFVYSIVFTIMILASSFILTSVSFNLPIDRDLVLTKMSIISDSMEGRLWCGVAGVLVVILVLLYLLVKARESHQEAAIAFDNPNGEVSISLGAIENFVMRVGKEFSEIKTLHPKIIARKDGVDIALKVDLWSGMNLPRVTETVQSVVKSQIQNILGIENVHSVEVMVSKIVSRENEGKKISASDSYKNEDLQKSVSEEN
ncbi:MAG: alkaline shock response membrane anchor protein AmaP [Candidatus Ancaeobacter aquaticus]|nr:alkaline shock response membrane anchor protein AmaP [Candidatus Ancaeobacter aquaticus]